MSFHAVEHPLKPKTHTQRRPIARKLLLAISCSSTQPQSQRILAIPRCR